MSKLSRSHLVYRRVFIYVFERFKFQMTLVPMVLRIDVRPRSMFETQGAISELTLCAWPSGDDIFSD